MLSSAGRQRMLVPGRVTEPAVTLMKPFCQRQPHRVGLHPFQSCRPRSGLGAGEPAGPGKQWRPPGGRDLQRIRVG